MLKIKHARHTVEHSIISAPILVTRRFVLFSHLSLKFPALSALQMAY